MYQLEVKRWLVFHKFPAAERWDVTIDVDPMELGKKGQHPAGKQAIAAECESWLRMQGVKLVRHPLYGRTDLVARKKGVGTFVVEVEGDSKRQKEQAMYSALGQVVLSMCDPSPQTSYDLAVPDANAWATQLRKVPVAIRELLRFELWLVSESGVRRDRNLTANTITRTDVLRTKKRRAQRTLQSHPRQEAKERANYAEMADHT